MKHLIGSLAVMSTDFKSGTFLASLESVECSTKSRLKPPVDIIEPQFMWGDNHNMINLGLVNLTSIGCSNIYFLRNTVRLLNLPNLKNIYNPNAFTNVIKIQIEANLHEDFCITTQEMQTFITTEFASLNCRPCKICENNVNMCNDSLENLLDNCTHVNGNVMIGPENEHLVSKLKIVETIYGSLIIRSTNLTHIAFLENLKHILTFNYSVSIIIENNPQFSNLTFPNLKRIYTNSLLTAIMLNNNSDILSPNFKNCDLIHAQFKYLKTKSISLDENTCEAIQRSANNTLEGKLANHPSLGIMGFLNLIIILGAL
ncbi:Receptor L-domain domain-containing protein [Caenorhabditis elegans]|nr:Receptor L-domain domain-containing protein [Caenorhabditis elegans]CUR30064.1 Receptor L-domain domain-containing protein [Caenorhabditis elegans]|eukprot:NP_001303765.1 Insulin/EGF-Receptor L Domain protein [Caenorhabditis elegans]